MSNRLINKDYFEKFFAAELLESMKDAAEPIIKKALRDAEERMRKDLAAHLISKIQTDYSIEYQGNILEIRVRQADPRIHREVKGK